MFELIQNALADVKWASLLSGGVLGALTIGLRTVLQAPVKALTEHSRIIRTLAFISPQMPFEGTWKVSWKVDSSKISPVNTENVRVFSLFGNITFATTKTLKDGTLERCVFVGKLTERTLTGRWFDPKNADRAYYGVYQVRLKGGLREAQGVWIGWTNDGEIQSNEMEMSRVDRPQF